MGIEIMPGRCAIGCCRVYGDGASVVRKPRPLAMLQLPPLPPNEALALLDPRLV
jgi:hypothetical protein